MQMESWRERGFVPDSDDEDGFDSQEKRVTQETRTADDDVFLDNPDVTAASGNDQSNTGGKNDVLEEELTLTTGVRGFANELEDVGSVDGDEDVDLLPLPVPNHRPRTPNNGGGNELDLGEPMAEEKRSTRGTSASASRLSERLSKTSEDDLSSTPRAKHQPAPEDMTRSSPDILQLNTQSPREPASPASTSTPKAQPASRVYADIENVESSPLSSPLSSLHSLTFDEREEPSGPEPSGSDKPSTQNLEVLLPPLEIPEDLLEQLDPPTRRSLRQRNPIQLHPYLIEDAKYQKLMKARGLKPVRVAQSEQRAPAAADESQNQDLGDDAGSTSDSQMTFQFPPSSPIDTRQLFEIPRNQTSADTRNRRSPPKPKTSNKTGPRSPKRRRVIGAEDGLPNNKLRPIPRPQVLIDNVSYSRPSDASSIFDIPSPPRSGTVSSPAQENTGFRFPRGFSPPIITPRTETRKTTKDIDEMPIVSHEVEDQTEDKTDVSDDARSPRSAENENEDAQEALTGLPNATQRNQERISRLEKENTKGVAKKITKKPGSWVAFNARAQLDKDGAEQPDDSDREEAHQRLVELLGLNDSYPDHDPDGDIPEDNRIDYMFPTASRNRPAVHTRKKRNKRNRVEENDTRSGLHSKKPRLKRQARLTDASLPKLGILDAQDVTSRVAARKARSRQDKGRRSPSRKIIQLNSRLDTEDANASLREWRSGRMRQTALPTAPSQTLQRQPLRDRTTNARDVFNSLGAKRVQARNVPKQQTTQQLRNTSRVRENGPPSATTTTSDTALSTREHATKPVQQRRGNARGNPRPVMPEGRSLALINRDDAAPRRSPRATDDLHKTQSVLPRPVVEPRRRQLKKRQPKKLDLNAAEDQLPLEDKVGGQQQLPPVQTIGRLSHFRTAYPLDFGASPLQSGIFFHESTFVGSGDFSRSLHIARRDLDKSAGFFQIKLGDRNMRWGAWDDTVSSGFGIAFDEILKLTETGNNDGSLEEVSRDVSENGHAMYRSLINYVSGALSFIDPIDRTAFVTRTNGLVSRLLEEVSIIMSSSGFDLERLIKVASHNLVFANQACQISCHDLVDQSIRDEALNLAKLASRQVTVLISSSTGQAAVRRFVTAGRSKEWREIGIKDDHPYVEAYVLFQHVLRSTDRFKGCLEDLVADAYSISDTEDINSLEEVWQQVFTTLPLQEIDALGMSRVGSRFNGGHDNWTAVKRLLSSVLDKNEADSKSHPISYYSYCRVLFRRCFVLINDWGWRDCKPILDTLYDFFAKRTLYNLRQEENHKSPAFLDELDGNPTFEVLPGDPCFRILLNIIGSGLRFLSKIYDKRKVRNYTWRLLPNHGRNYPKEQSIHQADLDALRNHHDLLCTLYSSVPDGCRPRLETIKALVHPASSHLETCKISLRSWTRLARFKLSTNEDLPGLEPFAEWHGYFVSEFLKQHNLARREIEAQNEGGKEFSQELIDRIVAQNQRQIESLLREALQGLQSAIKTAPTLEHAQKIVSQTPIHSILDLFSARTTRLNATVLEGLRVIVMYIEKCSSPSSASVTRENPPPLVDEDSQEYGDWSDLQAVCEFESLSITPGVEHVEKAFHPAVSRLVSNCFGEDRSPDDAILLCVVDCWTSIAHTLVSHRLRRWDCYVSPYDGESWATLRWTTQTRKFTPEFLAKCIEKDSQFLSDCKVQILGMWLSSLVERASMLKFQHRLTEALLNQAEEDSVLKNLPFVRDTKTGLHSITLAELNHRRLSTISSLLSNMREHIQNLDDSENRELATTRQDYRDLLQRMMSSMKSNYQELGNGEAEVQGAYVSFVHSIVGFLQQHTREICPIDPFFTDPASFPLPATDPTYIVARLKGYEPKLSSAKVAKTLIVFVQNVSERAALDGQQAYLANQLYSSMAETYESGNPSQPTLRATLLQCVFPAYLATAFDNPAAWILTLPVVETITRVFKSLLFNMDATDTDCIHSVLNIFRAVFESSLIALHRAVSNTNMPKEPTVLITIAALLDVITSALPVVDYIDQQIRNAQQCASFAIYRLENQPLTLSTPILSPAKADADTTINSISHSATRDLQAYLTERWSRHQGKYYFTRRGGHQPQEVEIEAPTAAMLDDNPTQRVIEAAGNLLDLLKSLDLLGEGRNEEIELEYEDPSAFGFGDEILLL
ncbi:Mus7/MMS22 family-domain-containing protein [Aspergillus karnatakaensis]|uniref:uncharacterized protein n=1 Tax=Aspergillus karnatakaensis TaxID=1810916 RepID=UPI003CCD2D32